MPDVSADNQRLAKEYVFGLLGSNVMALPILLRISVIPVETRAIIQRIVTFRHITKYTMNVYRIPGS
jgi:hypothetical protein